LDESAFLVLKKLRLRVSLVPPVPPSRGWFPFTPNPPEDGFLIPRGGRNPGGFLYPACFEILCYLGAVSPPHDGCFPPGHSTLRPMFFFLELPPKLPNNSSFLTHGEEGALFTPCSPCCRFPPKLLVFFRGALLFPTWACGRASMWSEGKDPSALLFFLPLVIIVFF